MNRFLSGCFIGAVGAALVSAPLVVRAQNDGNTVAAPFTVLGASGQPIFTIEEVDGGPRLTLLSDDGDRAVLGATADGMALVVTASSGNLASLVAGGETSVNVSVGQQLTRLVTNAQEQSITMETNGTKVVDLGSKATTNAALRIASPSGAMAAQIGSNQANGGAGAVYVNDSTGQTGAYMVALASAAGVVGISVGGQEVAKLEPNASNSGGKMSIADVNGNLAVAVGLTTDGKGTVCFYGVNGTQCL